MGELTKLRRGGVEWTVESRHADALCSGLFGGIHQLESLPAAALVKRSLARVVHRARLDDGSVVIVKAYLVRGWRDRVKGALLGPKPSIEWEASRRLLGMGIPASHAIAVGRPGPRRRGLEGYLVVEVLPDVTSIGDWLRTQRSAAAQNAAEGDRQFLHELAAFVRRLHDSGVSHHDLHRGNILVRTAPPSPEERFLVIDLHRMRVGRAPSAGHRAEAIAQLLHGLSGDLGLGLRDAVAAFLEAYEAAGRPLRTPRIGVDSILARIERRSAKRLGSRARRCQKESTQFTVEVVDGWRIYHRRDHAASSIITLWQEHRRARAVAAPSAEAPVITHHTLGGGGGEVEVREHPAPRLFARLFAPLRRLPGVCDYAAAHRRWLETGGGPVAIAGAECLRGPDRGTSFAVLWRRREPET